MRHYKITLKVYQQTHKLIVWIPSIKINFIIGKAHTTHKLHRYEHFPLSIVYTSYSNTTSSLVLESLSLSLSLSTHKLQWYEHFPLSIIYTSYSNTTSSLVPKFFFFSLSFLSKPSNILVWTPHFGSCVSHLMVKLAFYLKNYDLIVD